MMINLNNPKKSAIDLIKKLKEFNCNVDKLIKNLEYDEFDFFSITNYLFSLEDTSDLKDEWFKLLQVRKQALIDYAEERTYTFIKKMLNNPIENWSDEELRKYTELSKNHLQSLKTYETTMAREKAKKNVSLDSNTIVDKELLEFLNGLKEAVNDG
ncbi:MAG: hypothetical protein QXL94_00820 [Candidatus Parvarchaeum sp.]